MDKIKFNTVMDIFKYNDNICKLYSKLVEMELTHNNKGYNEIIELLRYEVRKADKLMRSLNLTDDEFLELYEILGELDPEHKYMDFYLYDDIENGRLKRFFSHYFDEYLYANKNIEDNDTIIIGNKLFNYSKSVELLESNNQQNFADLLKEKKKLDDKRRERNTIAYNELTMAKKNVEAHSFMESLDNVIKVSDDSFFKANIIIYKYAIISVIRTLENDLLFSEYKHTSKEYMDDLRTRFGDKFTQLYDKELSHNIDDLLAMIMPDSTQYRSDYNDIIIMSKIDSLYRLLNKKDDALNSIMTAIDLVKEDPNERNNIILSLIR